MASSYKSNAQRVNNRSSKRHRQKHKFLLLVTLILLLTVVMLLLKCVCIRVEVNKIPFTESARQLQNPNRGFYSLYSFWITDEQVDYQELINEKYQNDTDTELTLVKICLQNYRGNMISEAGLANIKNLFLALESLDKQLIIRVAYDDEGKNEQYEPENLDIILQHMNQLGPVFEEHHRQIFIIQGLFTGNWGEMNGTRYNSPEDMRKLANQLADVTDESIYLSVRTPAQWRGIIEADNPENEMMTGNPLAVRLGLFNDGILGNESDYGTYRTEYNVEMDSLGRWFRKEELLFQKELCRYVPNGGEVIQDNPYNDFENAVSGLAERRIAYLNKDYDQAVLQKWAEETVTEESCFSGMDGYSYIERHLGYRLLIADTKLEYRKGRKGILAEVSLKNVGFAPVYKEPVIRMTLCSEEGEAVFSKEMSYVVRNLAGGDESEMIQTDSVEIPLKGLSKSNYNVYFSIEDIDTGKYIELANEQEDEKYGYCIGTVRIY